MTVYPSQIPSLLVSAWQYTHSCQDVSSSYTNLFVTSSVLGSGRFACSVSINDLIKFIVKLSEQLEVLCRSESVGNKGCATSCCQLQYKSNAARAIILNQDNNQDSSFEKSSYMRNIIIN
ncbi:hypothetical protein KCU81_g375, partial [Aureobasidium melanogenum]